MNEDEEIIEFDIELYINILSHFGRDNRKALRICKRVTDTDIIKNIAEKAIKNENFIGKIHLRDQWKAASKLVKLGIISKDEFYNTRENNTTEKEIEIEIFIRSLELDKPVIELEKMISDYETMNYISKKALSNSFFLSKITIGNMQKAIDIFRNLGFIE